MSEPDSGSEISGGWMDGRGSLEVVAMGTDRMSGNEYGDEEIFPSF